MHTKKIAAALIQSRPLIGKIRYIEKDKRILTFNMDDSCVLQKFMKQTKKSKTNKQKLVPLFKQFSLFDRHEHI